MNRKALLGLMVGVAGLMAGPLHAGGWGVITLETLPDFVEAGKPVPLTFMVRGHGTVPAPGLRGTVEAATATERVSAPIAAGQLPGQYRATLTLPKAGDWVISIQAGYKVTLLPLTAVAPGTQPRAVSDAERGKRLFVAKGCVTCHQNTLRTENMSSNVGPALIPQKYQPEFLARMLADPAALIPPRPESPVRMPNLNLQPQEIAALVAFINTIPTTARR